MCYGKTCGGDSDAGGGGMKRMVMIIMVMMVLVISIVDLECTLEGHVLEVLIPGSLTRLGDGRIFRCAIKGVPLKGYS